MLRSTIESVPQGLVERCCLVTRIQKQAPPAQKQVRQAQKQDDDLQLGQEDLGRGQDDLERAEDNKSRHVLTAHGIVYIAKLVDKLMECRAVEYRDFPGTGIGSHCQLPVEQCTCIAAGKQLKAQFADISSEILGGLSKGDWLVRGLFFFQALWMITQCIVRRWTGLSLTLLELYAATHIGLAAARFLVWWRKPIDIILMTPLSLTKTELKTMQDAHTEESTGHYKFDKNLLRDPNSNKAEPTQAGIRAWWRDLLDMDDIDTCNANYFTSQASLGKSTIKQVTGRQSLREPLKAVVRTMVILALRGHHTVKTGMAWGVICLGHNAIYVAAWNWYFPTPFERVAWRVCTLLVFVALGGFMLCLFMGEIYYRVATRSGTGLRLLRPLYRAAVRLFGIIILVVVIPCVVAKLFCLIECLISLRKLPADTYDLVRWTSLLPHL